MRLPFGGAHFDRSISIVWSERIFSVLPQNLFIKCDNLQGEKNSIQNGNKQVFHPPYCCRSNFVNVFEMSLKTRTATLRFLWFGLVIL